jgi:hypothetical protein
MIKVYLYLVTHDELICNKILTNFKPDPTKSNSLL